MLLYFTVVIKQTVCTVSVTVFHCGHQANGLHCYLVLLLLLLSFTVVGKRNVPCVLLNFSTFSFPFHWLTSASSSCTSLLSPPSSSLAVKYGPCLLTLRKGSRLLKPRSWGNFSTSPTWSTKPQLGAGQDQPACWSTGTSFGNCQEMETSMVQACHTPWQPLQNHPSWRPGRWAMLWSAEEMLDGQHRRVDIPAHARNAHKGLPQKRLEEDLYWIIPQVPLPHLPPPFATTQSVKGLNWTER